MERCNTQACTREFVKILIIWRGVILKPAHVSLFRFCPWCRHMFHINKNITLICNIKIVTNYMCRREYYSSRYN
jgi:hypothetical protein